MKLNKSFFVLRNDPNFKILFYFFGEQSMISRGVVPRAGVGNHCLRSLEHIIIIRQVASDYSVN